MSILRKYEIMILLNEEFNASAIKSWSFNYAKNLKRLGVFDLSIISHGKKKLAYKINQKEVNHYIQLNFSTIPKYIKNLFRIFKLDRNISRFNIYKFKEEKYLGKK